MFSSLQLCAHTHTHTITHISAICGIITTNMLTFYYTTLITNCIITQISFMHTQHYACVDVLSKGTLAWILYYTHHKHKGAHHYVCVYVLSDCSVYWMLCYTLHKHKGAHHYVRVYVLSDCSFHWMLCYTLHKHGRSPLCTCLCVVRLLWRLKALLHTSQI